MSQSIAPILILMLLPFVTSAQACSNPILDSFVEQNYRQNISFDVYRKGKKVGLHTTRFERLATGLQVSSKMSLQIKVLMIPLYNFSYESVALWCEDRLKNLTATVSDNGDGSSVAAFANDATVVVEGRAGRLTANADIIPTNHWNPSVLSRGSVLNTITGNINQIRVETCAEKLPDSLASADCFQYSGDLTTRAWYDSKKRWVGLEFLGNDGSTIRYVSRGQGVDP